MLLWGKAMPTQVAIRTKATKHLMTLILQTPLKLNYDVDPDTAQVELGNVDLILLAWDVPLLFKCRKIMWLNLMGL
jgi:hypothetical protein